MYKAIGFKQNKTLIDVMGRECSHYQFLRELTVNAIEAILQTPERTGRIVWTKDFYSFEEEGVSRLCCIDTGCGMTEEQMDLYLGNLGTSSKEQGLYGNYGWGGRISSLRLNPAGVHYYSWQNAKGHLVKLSRQADGNYGLEDIFAYGRYHHVLPLLVHGTDVFRQEQIQEHGTKVVLCGAAADDNTLLPEGEGKHFWIVKYLNSRFFKFPEGITVSAISDPSEGDSDSREHHRSCYGAAYYLSRYSEAMGTLDREPYVAHWWILKKDQAKHHGFYSSSGHVAYLHRDEIIEPRSHARDIGRLGITGKARQSVVVYFEPKADVYSDATRKKLAFKDTEEELPFADWGEDFDQNMPTELRKYIREQAGTFDETFDDILRSKFLALLQRARFVKRDTGKEKAKDFDETRSEEGDEPDAEPSGPSNRPRKPRSRTKPGGDIGKFLALPEDGENATEMRQSLPVPQVKWTGPDEPWVGEAGEEDRAAFYNWADNSLLMNSDFSRFDMIRRFWEKAYRHKPERVEEIWPAIKKIITTRFQEIVITLHNQVGERGWEKQIVQDRLLSLDALTTAACTALLENHKIAEKLRESHGEPGDLPTANDLWEKP